MDSEPPPIPIKTRKRRPLNFAAIVSTFLENVFLLLGLCFLGYAIELADAIIRGIDFDKLGGITPRRFSQLHGVITAHCLHGDFVHLISNTVPFFVLGGFVLMGGRSMFWKVTLFVALMGGGLLWLLGIGRNSVHIGASMVIFGYLGFLLSRGIFERSIFWIIISVITLFFYGGLLLNVLPGQAGISWEGHLYGFIAGITAAKILVPRHGKIYQSIETA